MPVELIENGIEAEMCKQLAFFKLAVRLRTATDPEEAKRLADELAEWSLAIDAPRLRIGGIWRGHSSAFDWSDAQPGDQTSIICVSGLNRAGT